MLVRSSGVCNETHGQVLLVDKSRLTFGEQERDRTTFDERTNKVRAHRIVVTKEK